MDTNEIRLIVRQKLQNGRLPYNRDFGVVPQRAKCAMRATSPSRSSS
jgi:hypothetical protein